MIPKNLNRWLKEGDRGISSEAIATKLTDINVGRWGLRHPLDPSDFGRCVALLEAVPEFKARLDEMKSVSLVWTALVENWAELEAIFQEEVSSGRAPKLYDRMQELIEGKS